MQRFLRGSAAVAPTPAGDDFYRHATGLLRARDAAMRSVRAHTGTLQGEIKIGLMPTMTRLCLAPALARFLDAQPNILMWITEACSVALLGLVRAGELDFAVVPGPVASPGLRAAPVLLTQEVLVSRRDSGLPHLGPVALRSLPPPRLVLPGPGNARR